MQVLLSQYCIPIMKYTITHYMYILCVNKSKYWGESLDTRLHQHFNSDLETNYNQKKQARQIISLINSPIACINSIYIYIYMKLYACTKKSQGPTCRLAPVKMRIKIPRKWISTLFQYQAWFPCLFCSCGLFDRLHSIEFSGGDKEMLNLMKHSKQKVSKN